MAANEIRQNDIGTVFEVTVQDNGVPVDVSGATGPTDKQLIFEKPSGPSVTQDAAFTTDGTDGKIKYTTVADDLDENGEWRLQGYVNLPGGEWRTEITTFEVHRNL